MMREPDLPSGAITVTIDVTMEVYLKDRQDPISYIGTFFFNRDHLNEDALLESFMSIVTRTLRSVIDDRSETMFILSDVRSNKFLILTDEIQAISILAPSEETILITLGDEIG